MKHTIEQVALAHKRYNQTKYKHRFLPMLYCDQTTNRPEYSRGSLHCSHLFYATLFSGACCVHFHIFLVFLCSKMHTVCSVFVFKSRLFYGFCCTSTKSFAYVDVTLVKKTRKNTIVLRLLFVYLNSNVLCLLKQRENKNTYDKFK